MKWCFLLHMHGLHLCILRYHLLPSDWITNDWCLIKSTKIQKPISLRLFSNPPMACFNSPSCFTCFLFHEYYDHLHFHRETSHVFQSMLSAVECRGQQTDNSRNSRNTWNKTNKLYHDQLWKNTTQNKIASGTSLMKG